MQVNSDNIKSAIKTNNWFIFKKKGLDERNVQILAPMYKGEAGIDALNLCLQEIYNPRKEIKKK